MRGVYLITNDDDFSILIKKIELALQSGVVTLLQYRRKQVDLAQQPVEIEAIAKICQQYAVPLIINDHLHYAKQFGCGLHLGQGDGSLVEARQHLGSQAIIGRTCHASLVLAEQAVTEQASYLAFGAVYLSGTKPNASHVSIETLGIAKQQFQLPICVIGGLTVENSLPLVQAGVDLFAVVGDIFNLPVQHIASRMEAWQRVLLTKP